MALSARAAERPVTRPAGAAAIGRRVWGSKKPAATLRAIRALVLEGAPLEKALAIYHQTP